MPASNSTLCPPGRKVSRTVFGPNNMNSTSYDVGVTTLAYGGTYTLLVQATGNTNASYTLKVFCVPPVPVTFDGGAYAMTTNHPGDTWRYFKGSANPPSETSVGPSR